MCCLRVHAFVCPRGHVGAFFCVCVQPGAFGIMFSFVHVCALQLCFYLSRSCIQDCAFICPRRFMFDLSDQVGAFGFTCLCGHVGALEFMYSSVHVGAFRINYVFVCPRRRIGVCVFIFHVLHSGLCFYLSTSIHL